MVDMNQPSVFLCLCLPVCLAVTSAFSDTTDWISCSSKIALIDARRWEEQGDCSRTEQGDTLVTDWLTGWRQYYRNNMFTVKITVYNKVII